MATGGGLFGKYELVELLGHGGMAEVWKAKFRGAAGFERMLVVKRVLPQLARDQEFVDMFVREAQLCSMLTHANIVQVIELGELAGEYYLAMEYVRGKDVQAIMRAKPKEPPPPGITALIGREIGRALGYAHALCDEQGRPLRLIHRDVTPSNVMVGFDGGVKLVDFGLAKAMSLASGTITSTSNVRGKLGYLAPEQLAHSEIDHRADLFAVGVMLHEMLTGRRLFSGDDDAEVIEQIRSGTIYAPSQINPLVPKELDVVVMRALERDPAHRYQSGDELADALDARAHALRCGPAQLATFMRARFAPTEIAADALITEEQTPLPPTGARRDTLPMRSTLALVRAVEQMGAWQSDSGPHVVGTPAAAPAADALLAERATQLFTALDAPLADGPTKESPSPSRPRRSRGFVLGVAVGLVLGAVALGCALRGLRGSSAVTAPAPGPRSTHP